MTLITISQSTDAFVRAQEISLARPNAPETYTGIKCSKATLHHYSRDFNTSDFGTHTAIKSFQGIIHKQRQIDLDAFQKRKTDVVKALAANMSAKAYDDAVDVIHEGPSNPNYILHPEVAYAFVSKMPHEPAAASTSETEEPLKEDIKTARKTPKARKESQVPTAYEGQDKSVKKVKTPKTPSAKKNANAPSIDSRALDILSKFPFKTMDECTSKATSKDFFISRKDLIQLIDSDAVLKEWLGPKYASMTKEEICRRIFASTSKTKST